MSTLHVHYVSGEKQSSVFIDLHVYQFVWSPVMLWSISHWSIRSVENTLFLGQRNWWQFLSALDAHLHRPSPSPTENWTALKVPFPRLSLWLRDHQKRENTIRPFNDSYHVLSHLIMYWVHNPVTKSTVHERVTECLKVRATCWSEVERKHDSRNRSQQIKSNYLLKFANRGIILCVSQEQG